MKVAIVGLPMSGKTTLFQLLTGGGGSGAAVHSGRAQMRQTRVHDSRIERLVADYSPKKVTFATIDFLDFPAIVSAGGQERKSCADLLAPAREAGALLLVVRAFDNMAVPPIRGHVDAAADLADLVEELKLADLDIADRRRQKIITSLPKKRGDERKPLEVELALLERIVAHLEGGGELLELELNPAEQKQIRGFQFLSGKPRLVVENVGDGRAQATLEAALAVPVAIEEELEELDEESQQMFREEYGIAGSSKNQVVEDIYRRSGLISFLTAGDPEVRAWTIPAGTPAVEAAATIHSDISRGFIRAEVVSYQDYVEDGGHSGAREKGHLRLEGKEYIVQDGDIILFRFNV